MKEFLRRWTPRFIKNWVHRRRTRAAILSFAKLAPLPLSELKKFLTTEMGLRSGDTLFIHASFSDLKCEGTADELVQMLVDIVGPQGNILMPFYPIKASHAALLEGKPFDLRKNRTSMGALVTAFVKRVDVRKSIHPTKAVAVFGKDQTFLISDHHKSIMPYGAMSPYHRIQDLNRSKIIGLGVTSDFLSCMHVAVDEHPQYPIQPYHPLALEGTVIDYEGHLIQVRTYGHDLSITTCEDVPRFLNETKCPTYQELTFQGRTFFTVDARELVRHVYDQGTKGETFFYPRSLQGKQPPRLP